MCACIPHPPSIYCAIRRMNTRKWGGLHCLVYKEAFCGIVNLIKKAIGTLGILTVEPS